MQLIIDRATSTITKDGKTYVVDLRQLQPEITRVAWHDDHGTVSYSDGRTTGLGDWRRFKELVDLWDEKHSALLTRATFTVPDGYETVRDVEGRATGELRKVRS
jgi:hypothetical protein